MPNSMGIASSEGVSNVADELAAQSRGVLGSRLWFSDREIETPARPSISYTSDDFRRELARVERRLYWLTAGSIAIAVLAIVGIIGIIIQSG